MIAVMEPSSVDMDRIQAALSHSNGQTLANVLENINNGTYVLLRASESSMVIMLEPNNIHVNQMGGVMKDVPVFLDCLVQIAKDMGKRYISLEGRKGWQRVLKPLGCYPEGNRIVYDLEGTK